jgi:hypothetical protein
MEDRVRFQIVPLPPNACRSAASRVAVFIWPMWRPSTLPLEEKNTVVGKAKRRYRLAGAPAAIVS